MSAAQGKKTKSGPTIKKVQNKSSPEEKVSLKLVDNSDVGQHARFVIALSGKVQVLYDFVLHRPIGVTDLEGDEWVISSPDEVKQMTSKMVDPNFEMIKAKRTEYVNTELCKARIYNKVDGIFVYSCKLGEEHLTRKELQDMLKAKHIKENGKEAKFDFQSALKDYDEGKLSEIVELEKDAQNLRKTLYEKAEDVFPQTFRTMKGTMNDVPQVGQASLKGLDLNQAAGFMMMYGTSGQPQEDDESLFEEEGTVNSDGEQWFFCSSSIGNRKKKAIRKLANRIRKIAGDDSCVQVGYKSEHPLVDQD